MTRKRAPVCSIPGCPDRHLARGLCNKHYLRWKAAGGQTKPRARLWTIEEDLQLLRAGLCPHTERHAGKSRIREIAAALGRTPSGASHRWGVLMKKLGHKAGKQWTKEGLWTEEEDREIARIVEEHPRRVPAGTWPDVAEHLGRTVGAVTTRASVIRQRLLQSVNRSSLRIARGMVGVPEGRPNG